MNNWKWIATFQVSFPVSLNKNKIIFLFAHFSPTEKLPSYQSEGSLQKSLASDEDSIINYSEGGSFMGEHGDGKKAAPHVKFI